MASNNQIAVVTGIAPGLGEAVAHRFREGGYTVIGLSRSLPASPNAATTVLNVDLADATAVAEAFALIDREFGEVSVLIHNAFRFVRGSFLDVPSAEFEAAWRATALSAVNTCYQAIPRMLARGGGAIILTGATASVRASAGFAALSSAKFALRALAGALAREFHGQNVHVVHAILDGVIWSEASRRRFDGLTIERCLDSGEIADAYWTLAHQPPSCWSHEIDLRPNSGSF